MATGETSNDENTEALATLEANLARIDGLTQRLLAVMASKRQVRPSLQGPGQELYLRAAQAYWQEMVNNPAKLIGSRLR